MRDSGGTQRRQETAANGQLTRSPAGYRKVGCGTIYFYDTDGGFLRIVRMGCMPETKKKTLKCMLSSELGRVFAQRPELTLVAIADGANDNWSYLQDEVLNLLSEAIARLQSWISITRPSTLALH